MLSALKVRPIINSSVRSFIKISVSSTTALVASPTITPDTSEAFFSEAGNSLTESENKVAPSEPLVTIISEPNRSFIIWTTRNSF